MPDACVLGAKYLSRVNCESTVEELTVTHPHAYFNSANSSRMAAATNIEQSQTSNDTLPAILIARFLMFSIHIRIY